MKHRRLLCWLIPVAVLAPVSSVTWCQPSGFPFAIEGDRFTMNGEPVFLSAFSYQPLEPGQGVAD